MGFVECSVLERVEGAYPFFGLDRHSVAKQGSAEEIAQ